jgi:alpha-tubulin suppressor-like RCC1 family protein
MGQDDHNTPEQIGTSTNNGWVGAGSYAACTITTDSSHLLACIGENSSGQGGNGVQTYSGLLTPVSGGGEWVSAGLGHEHTCGVQANNTLWCFGNGNAGRLGTGNESNTSIPVQIGTDHLWTAVDSGTYHSCAITTGRDLYCWGYNQDGQLGDGTTADRFAPVLIIDGAELPATNTAVEAQRAQVLAQLALLAAVCAFAVRMSAPIVESKGKRRR